MKFASILFMCFLSCWTLDGATAYFRIRHIATGKVLEVNGWRPISVYLQDVSEERKDWQSWYLENNCHDDVYFIRNKVTLDSSVLIPIVRPPLPDEDPFTRLIEGTIPEGEDSCTENWVFVDNKIVYWFHPAYRMTLQGTGHSIGDDVYLGLGNPGNNNDEWERVYNYFYIQHRASGKVLDACDDGNPECEGVKVILWDKHGDTNQHWRREGHYIINRMFDRVLEFDNDEWWNSHSNPDSRWGKVFLADIDNGVNYGHQSWSTGDPLNYFPEKMESYWNLRGLVLDVYGGNAYNGADVGCHEPNGQSSQDWDFVPV